MTLFQRDRENREEGRAEGRAEGSDKMATLTKILLAENLMDELHRALEDKDYRNELFEKYQL